MSGWGRRPRALCVPRPLKTSSECTVLREREREGEREGGRERGREEERHKRGED